MIEIGALIVFLVCNYCMRREPGYDRLFQA